MLKKIIFLLPVLLLTTLSLVAKEGYEIKVKVDNFEEKELFLGYHYGDKQYFKDSTVLNDAGYFVFSGEETLPGGVYLIIMPPNNQYFEILVDKGEQHYTVHVDQAALLENRKIIGSPENQLFYSYSLFLNKRGEEVANLRKQMEAETEGAKKKALEEKMIEINTSVKEYQNNLVAKHPKSLTAAIVRSSWDVDVPKMEGTEDEVKLKRFQYYRGHYFDNVDLADNRLIYGPILFKKVINFVDNLTYQHPDSISQTLDVLLAEMKPADETFKFFLVHFLNKYAKSKFVGMDGVYVHLAKKYYCEEGAAWWVDEEQKAKICKNANTLIPILIGKTAPDLLMQKEDGTKLKLHDVDAKYTVMFFWDPDCGHCKKSMPDVLEFYDKYAPKGVEIFAICTKVTKDVPSCWKTIKERKMGSWINVVDPFLLSKYKTIYDIRTTPRVFILDKDKKIISKGIAGEQLEEVMEKLMQQEQLGKSGGGASSGK